jgi:hypothetical protein
MRFGIDRQTYGQPETWRFISFVGWESIPWEAIVVFPLALLISVEYYRIGGVQRE